LFFFPFFFPKSFLNWKMNFIIFIYSLYIPCHLERQDTLDLFFLSNRQGFLLFILSVLFASPAWSRDL
jgi:hypothetical protein